MTKMKIYTVPDPVLRAKAAPVEKVDARVQTLMSDMLETMYADDGIGLAATQVGALDRVIVVDISQSRDGSEALLMANPVVTWKSEDTFTYREGCLSVRPCSTESSADLYADVTRPRSIRVSYLDRNGEAKEMEAQELLSQCIQHEIDHLDGILFIDHISALKRGIIMRKIDKLRRLMGTGSAL
ncbi:MAG: peptide deformylase [Bdellovibrionales bacterium]